MGCTLRRPPEVLSMGAEDGAGAATQSTGAAVQVLLVRLAGSLAPGLLGLPATRAVLDKCDSRQPTHGSGAAQQLRRLSKPQPRTAKQRSS